MIFHQSNKEIISIYRCPICKGTYLAQTGDIRIRCAVNHSPGSCCHYAERPINEEKIIKIEEIINED